MTGVTQDGVARYTDMDRAEELALVRRLRAGDSGALDEVYAAFRPRLFAFLARLTRRADLAEDLLGEVWLRLMTHAGRLDPETRLAPWLFTVARNLFWSYCRSRVVENHSGTLIGLWPEPPLRPSPYEVAAAHELDARFEHALAALPALYREVLLLTTVHGLTAAEAAAACGVSPEALRKRLSRARALLAAAIIGHPHQEHR